MSYSPLVASTPRNNYQPQLQGHPLGANPSSVVLNSQRELTNEQIKALPSMELQAVQQLVSLGVFSFHERILVLILTAEPIHGSREHDGSGY